VRPDRSRLWASLFIVLLSCRRPYSLSSPGHGINPFGAARAPSHHRLCGPTLLSCGFSGDGLGVLPLWAGFNALTPPPSFPCSNASRYSFSARPRRTFSGMKYALTSTPRPPSAGINSFFYAHRGVFAWWCFFLPKTGRYQESLVSSRTPFLLSVTRYRFFFCIGISFQTIPFFEGGDSPFPKKRTRSYLLGRAGHSSEVLVKAPPIIGIRAASPFTRHLFFLSDFPEKLIVLLPLSVKRSQPYDGLTRASPGTVAPLFFFLHNEHFFLVGSAVLLAQRIRFRGPSILALSRMLRPFSLLHALA